MKPKFVINATPNPLLEQKKAAAVREMEQIDRSMQAIQGYERIERLQRRVTIAVLASIALLLMASGILIVAMAIQLQKMIV